MKSLISVISAMLVSVSAFCTDSLSVFYRIRLDGDIDAAAQRLVVLGLEKAEEADADYVMLDLDTYGGAVNAADSIRTAILRYEKPVIVYVNMQAASAGALISIACDSIYMRTGSSIGAATVVDQSGGVMPDKYQSFMRGMMRSTAQATGRDPEIAEAMVDTADVLSLTPEEAVRVGYCDGIYDTEVEVAHAVIGDNSFIIKNMEDDLTWLDRLIQILLNPLLRSIFMMMIIGGIFVEIRTPGIGLPLLTAVVGALLYFAPAYLGHLVSYWEILLFVAGLILIGVEIFVLPGFGVCGVTGIIAVVVSLAFAMVDNADLFHWDGSLNLQPVIMPLGIVILSASAAIFGSVWLVRKLYPTRTFDHVALRQSLTAEEGFTGVVSGLEGLVGEPVVVFTDMRPSGKVKTTDGRILEAVLKFGGYAEKGETLKVLSAEQGRLYCDRLK
ncbi:MAG: nodulation protein NfeD [Bacteroidales bacterium]|nr:nodulation protein NfeD [Bacteroidales bacterium]MBQ9723001.1 nodulation protein NfeD [Bacteroidales bacterium]